MRSIVNRAIARLEQATLPEDAGEPPVAEEDEELRQLVDSLSVSIKIMGCGGGGCNTISRLSESGIVGAQLSALNTDANHLL
ncbi:MAG: cell division protein FtsZ, partial [Thermoplasmata archaeon]|nr:cell division protein FtsZ [Thermoplasmata archaeon]